MPIKYKKADKSIIFNQDPDLEEIEVLLPNPPDTKDIIGYGLSHKEQKFKRPFIPVKLFELNKDKKISLFDKATILKDDHEYYEEEINFIQKEWDRRINGVWYYINGKPTYIPGVYYFYLTAWYLERGYPDYRERDRKFFLFSEFCENDDKCYGFIYPKHRREGATTKAACWSYEYVSRNRRVRGGIQSMTDTHAELVFQKHVVSGWRKLPFWYKPMFEGSTNPKSELSLNAPSLKITRTNMGIDEMDSLESSIDFMPSTEGAYDGSRLERYHGDEVGKSKTVNVYKRHLVVKQCLSEGTEIIGKAIYTSTAGEMSKGGGEQFKKLIETSNYYKRDGNGRTTSGLYALFIPATEGLKGKIDEFGDSVIDDPIDDVYDGNGKLITMGSLNYLLNERKQALDEEDYEKLNESTRQFPVRLRDCFRNASDSDNFNMKIIQDQRDKYQFGNNDVTIGDFEWEKGVVDGRVIFVPKENGKFKVSWLHPNPQESNRFLNIEGVKVPANYLQFVAGSDTFKFKNTKSSKKSDGGGAVFMKRNHTIDTDERPIEDWETYKFICTYLYRPPDKDIYCEDMLMMCIYYGCKMCPEINVPAVMDHFNRRGYQGYLHYVINKKTGRYEKNPGYNTGVKELETMFRLYHAYIQNHGYRIVHDDLLEQLQEITDDMGDYDLFTAGGECLMAIEDEEAFYFGDREDEEEGEDISNYFRIRTH